MTITKERLAELVHKVGGAMEPGLAPVFNTHAQVHKLAQLIRNEVLEESAKACEALAITACIDSNITRHECAASIRAMKEQL